MHRKKGFLILAFWLGVLLAPRPAYATIDSLRALLNRPQPDTTRMRILQQLTELSAPGQWQLYNDQLKKMAEEKLAQTNIPAGTRKKLLHFQSWAYYNKAIDYLEQSDSKNAAYWLNAALQIAEKYHHPDIEAGANHQLGGLAWREGDHGLASVLLYKALRLYEKTGDGVGQADVLMAIGEIHHHQQKNDEALRMYQRALRIQENIHDSLGIEQVLRKIAVLHQEKKEFEMARKYYARSLAILQKAHIDPRQEANAMNNLGRLMWHLQKNDSALYYFRQGLAMYEKLGDREGISAALRHMANTLYSLKKYPEALAAIDRSLELALEINYMFSLHSTYATRYKVLKALGRYREALDSYEKFNHLNDSIQGQTASKALTEQKLRYEFEKKELLSKARQEEKLARMETEAARKSARQNTWIVVLVAFVVLLVAGGYFLYKYLRQRNTIARQQANLLQQKLLVSQMNPHFIFNSLNAIQNYIFRQDSLQAGTYLSRFADLMRMILEYSRKDFISLDQETELLTHYLGLQQLRFEGKFEYSISVDEQLEPEQVLLPPMLAQPFIENALEHGLFYREKDGRLDVHIRLSGNRLVYEIQDNGVGIEQAMKQKAQRVKKHESLAMTITRDRLSGYNDGVSGFEVTDLGKSGAGEGVKVTINIPFREK